MQMIAQEAEFSPLNNILLIWVVALQLLQIFLNIITHEPKVTQIPHSAFRIPLTFPSPFRTSRKYAQLRLT